MQTCAIQHWPRKREGGLRQPHTRSSGTTKKTPKQPRSSDSASHYILPHLHESIAQSPDGDSPEQGVGLQQALRSLPTWYPMINAQHSHGVSVMLRPAPKRWTTLAVPPADRQPTAGLGEMEDVGWRWKHFSHSLIKRGVIRPLMPSEEWIRAVCNDTVFSRSLSPKRPRERVGARPICFLGLNSFIYKVNLGEPPTRNHWRCISQELDVNL